MPKEGAIGLKNHLTILKAQLRLKRGMGMLRGKRVTGKERRKKKGNIFVGASVRVFTKMT